MANPVRLTMLRLFAITWAVIGSGCSSCGTQPLGKAIGIFSMQSLVDFHNVCLNSTSTFDVPLNNKGLGPVNIESATVTNPAFTIVSMVPKQLAPLSSAKLTISFTPTAAQMYSGFLIVKTDAKENGTQQATLVGSGFSGPNVDFEVSCKCDSDGTTGLMNCGNGATAQSPCYFLDFGNVTVGTTANATVTVENLGCEPVTFNQALIYDTTDTPPATAAEYVDWFSVDPQPPTVLRGGETADYAVHMNPTEAAQQNVRMTLKSNDPTVHTGQTAAGAWDLGLFGTAVQPALLVTPNILTFFNAQVGTPSSGTFTIENTGTSDLSITSVALTGDMEYSLQIPGGSPSFMLAAGNMVTVTVTLTATSGGSKVALVTVAAQGVPSQTVQLIGGPEPAMTVVWLDPTNGMAETPPPVDFGMTTTGATNVTRTVRLKNMGAADLSVSMVKTLDITGMMNSGSFTVPAFNAVTIPAGMSSDMVVNFDDEITIQNDSGKLAITSNDPVDAMGGGTRTVDMLSTNTAVYAPVPDIVLTPASPQACTTTTLDASGTTSPQNDPMTFAWTVNSLPAGSHATLTAPTADKTNVTSSGCMGPDVPGTYNFTLTVTDQTYPSLSTSQPQTVVVH